MYAIVANGYVGIVESYRELMVLASIYPYPKYTKVKNREDAYAFIERNKRRDRGHSITRYGSASKTTYATVEYFIYKDDVYVNIDTSKLGTLVLGDNLDNNHIIDNRPSLIRLKIKDMFLNNESIVSHCIAIYQILIAIGEFVDINIIVPDISVYLALTKYTGDKYNILRTQNLIKDRFAGLSITVRE